MIGVHPMEFIQQIKVFVTVADLGSFAKAADALHMTRPSVSNAITTLENQLATRLLHRTTRRSSLTAEGELFYHKAIQLLADVAEAQNLFGRTGQPARGRLRVEIPVAVASTVIIPRLPEFRQLYPDIELILGVSDQPADLVAEGIDCVLRIGGSAPPTMVSRQIAQIPMLFCASPDYLTKHGTPVSTDELQQHQIISYFSGRVRQQMEWSVKDGAAEQPLHLRPTMLVNNTAAYVDCDLAGMGLIMVAGVYVEAQLHAGTLIEVLPDRDHVSLPLSVLYPHRQHLSLTVRAFVDWVVEVFRQQNSRWITAS